MAIIRVRAPVSNRTPSTEDGDNDSRFWDANRAAVNEISNSIFMDGAIITEIPVEMNIPYTLQHDLGRPVTTIFVLRVQGVNQVIVRLDTNTPNGFDFNTQLLIRPSATGVIDVWVA